MYLNVKSVLPNLVINDCKLNYNKCNNKLISAVLKSKVFHDYNRGLYVQVPDMETWPIMDKAHSKFIKCPIPVKVKETHFKIIHKVYPVADFLKKRFI